MILNNKQAGLQMFVDLLPKIVVGITKIPL
jgi:hypothetical protein